MKATLERKQVCELSGVDPYFQSEGVRLYRGDVLDLASRLPSQSIDVVIADPPYCSGGTSTAERQRDPVQKYCHNSNALGKPTFGGDHRDQRSFTYWCTLWLSALRDATVESGYCLVFIDWRQLPSMTDAIQAAGWTWRGLIAWDKGRGARAPHKGFFRHQCEYVVWATNGPVPKRTDAGPFDGCYHVPVRKNDKFHITGKPTELLRQLVSVAHPGATILDPFSGSGTTGVAAKIEGRNFVGFELATENCQITTSRLAKTTLAA